MRRHHLLLALLATLTAGVALLVVTVLAPGEIGPAAIAGHVDSPDGPAVFTGLDALGPGDLVEVDDADGETVAFRVDRLDTAPKEGFPTRAVYGQTPDPQLRLITCGGSYDSADGGYQDNLIVYATEVST